jgi:tetratricopeptide (TPR) repeat protein
MRTVLSATALLIPLICTSSVLALDVVKMQNGKVFEGKIIDEDYDIVKLKTKFGVVELSKEEIDKIERGLDIDKEFERKFAEAKTADNFYHLGVWCERFQRKELAKKCYEKAIELKPLHEPSRIKLGHKKYRGKWYSEEEYNRDVRGLVRHEGKWIPKADKEKIDAGYVKVDGRWVSEEDAPEEEQTRKIKKSTEKKAAPEKKSAKNWTPTPIFSMDEYKDLTAACSWANRKTINTDHYIIYTNVKDKFANKYKDMLEKLYDRYCKVFGHKGKMPYKFKICIYNSRQEFVRVTRMAGAGGFYTLRQKTLQVFHGWIPTLESGTQQVIQHEGTHQFQDMVMKNMMRSPIWLLEGLAVFFESSVFDEDRDIHIGAIPKKRLEDLQKVIKSDRYIRLATLIKTPQSRFRVPEYNHAWSLIYWLVYTSKNNQKVFNRYWGKCCEGGDSRNSRGFLDAIGVPIEKLEEHWKEWVMILSPEDMPEDVKKKSKAFNRKWNPSKDE